MRSAGRIPAVVYGHGRESISLSLRADEVAAALRRGVKLVQLKGGVTDDAVIRQIQWDNLGVDVLHLDFTRVSAHESIETRVTVECRGDAPGTHAGGILEQPLHEIHILCPVTAIPDRLTVNVNSLGLNGSITAGDLDLPEGAKLLTSPTAVVVQCVQRVELEEEVVAAPAEPGEPEVIGRRAEEGESEGGD
jgi:large subunit ribosomal protein L25